MCSINLVKKTFHNVSNFFDVVLVSVTKYRYVWQSPVSMSTMCGTVLFAVENYIPANWAEYQRDITGN